MRYALWLVAVALVSGNGVHSRRPAKRFYSSHDYYVLEHDPAGGATLDDCASTLGLEIVEPAGELQNHWLLRVPHSQLPSREVEEDTILTRLHTLRSSSDTRLPSREVDGLVSKSISSLSRQVLRQRIKRAPPPIRPGSDPEFSEDEEQNFTAQAIAARFGILDPRFTEQWHLVNDENPSNMMNVAPVWAMGITGEGVITSLIDDGLDYESDDLAANFDAVDSYDFNDHVPLPKPVKFDDQHGTRCAGQIAAVKNDVCGMGIAYKSKVAGVRILSGEITDVDEAAAMNYGFQNVSIYSCSWGPPDNGQSMEAPGPLIQKAIVNGVQNGRRGKGSIYVFASGNGARSYDQCNFDGFTNSIYSVTVAAIDHKGMRPSYSEACAANMVVAYSSGGGKSIVTTDVGKAKCASNHGGTSAAAPNAAGVIALALEARPDLTWRDVQHLCVKTAVKINPDDPEWEDTASGNRFNYKYGYGAIDAYEFVTAAQSWELVKPQAWLSTPASVLDDGSMDERGSMSGGAPITADGITDTQSVTAQMVQDANFEKLEHVTVTVWISHSKRGDVEVELLSPRGIKSVLAGQRQFDKDTSGFPGWTFMTIKHWAEDPIGEWALRVFDQGTEGHNGSFLGWTMNFFGSTIDPAEAKPYLVLSDNYTFPPPPGDYGKPLDPSFTIIHPTSTKQHAKPTDHLPSDHSGSEGENSKPAFPKPTLSATDEIEISEPSASHSSDVPSNTSTPTPDEGWFPDMSSLAHNQKWVIGTVAVVCLFALGAGAFFWRRRQQRWRRTYGRVAGGEDDMVMSSLDGGRMRLSGRDAGRTKELYDAFGDASDEEVDEETGLQAGSSIAHLSNEGIGYHSGFLDDDDATPGYKDDPDQEGET